MKKALKAALSYRKDFHFSVIPINVYYDNKEGKLEKVPLVSWTEFQERIATEEEIISWWKKWPDARVGIVTGKLSNLFIVDLDSDEAKEAFDKTVPDTFVTPMVFTPRGGHHHYFRHTEGFPNKSNYSPGLDIRTQGGYIVAPPSEANGDGRQWSWNVEAHPRDIPIADAPASLLAFLKERILNNSYSLYKGSSSESNKQLQELQSVTLSLNEGSRDDSLFHIANSLIKGGMSKPNASYVLDIIAKNCNPPFPHKDAEEKIKSALNRSQARERNIAKEVEDVVGVTEGLLTITNLYKELHLVTKDQRNAAKVAIHRLCSATGPLKRGAKLGTYEVKDAEPESFIDIFAADSTPLKIKWPLNVHDLVKIMPKNIIMVAGEVNAGKSAYLLNVAAMNMDDHEVIYFSSEMGGAELKERLQLFDFPLENWKAVKFIERASNFSDKIRPNAINIIDFLELHDEFYKMGGLIKEVFDKLDKGIAIIAIQKNRGRDEGLGGERSKEKARLYMAIEPGKLKIVKAKNWINSATNPNGMVMEFKLAKGCNFKAQGFWKREEK